jgi:NAD(P)-dependent dehydrogenase (short-subunit alcohol dehydrogenase family)
MHKGDGLFRLDGKVALVAGAASGIGRAAARGLAAAGAHVVCGDVNDAQPVAEETGGEAIALDITDEASVAKSVHAIREQHGHIDVLVSTPAVNVRKPLLDYSAEEFDKVIRLNLKGTFLIAQAVGKVMLAQKSGSVILLSSIRSVTVEPGQGVYAATKAGLVQMAGARGGTWSGGREGELHCARCGRDSADRADQRQPGLVQRVFGEECAGTLGKCGRNGGSGSVPGV